MGRLPKNNWTSRVTELEPGYFYTTGEIVDWINGLGDDEIKTQGVRITLLRNGARPIIEQHNGTYRYLWQGKKIQEAFGGVR